MVNRRTARQIGQRGLLLLPLALAGVGCHSPFVNATLRNETGGTVSPVEVDYPGASFGIPSLASGATYSYRFKILGSGGSKIVWTDAAQHDHTVAGPAMQEGEEGTLQIVLSPTGVRWTPALHNVR